MAIQISEKGLSPAVTKALANAKNKSQFLRDALEFYVDREVSVNLDLKEDIKEIKSLLSKIVLETAQSEVVATKEVLNTNENKIFSLVESSKKLVKNKEPKRVEKSIDKEKDITIEAKKEAEKMLDDFINNFV